MGLAQWLHITYSHVAPPVLRVVVNPRSYDNSLEQISDKDRQD